MFRVSLSLCCENICSVLNTLLFKQGVIEVMVKASAPIPNLNTIWSLFETEIQVFEIDIDISLCSWSIWTVGEKFLGTLLIVNVKVCLVLVWTNLTKPSKSSTALNYKSCTLYPWVSSWGEKFVHQIKFIIYLLSAADAGPTVWLFWKYVSYKASIVISV